jgi:hypothetical protein
MKIPNSIGNFFKGGAGHVTAKLAGIAGLGLVAYDAHYIGKVRADRYACEKDIAATDHYVNNAMYTTNLSKSQDGLRTAALHMQLDQGIRRFFNLGIGYLKGFSSMLVEHIVPLGFSAGALLAKGKTQKVCAGGLGLYSAYVIVKNFFGFGNPGRPLKP